VASLGEEIEREFAVRFLRDMKDLAAKGKLSFATTRQEYIQTLAYLGLKPAHARQVVLDLTVENYLRGAGLETKRENEERCDFGVYIDGEPVYIKVIIDREHSRALCVSFHIAKWDINRRFAEGGEET